MTLAPFRRIDFVEPRVDVVRRTDGALILKNPHPMGEPPANVLAPLRAWAEKAPDAQAGCQFAGRGAFARARRSVNGDYQGCAPARQRLPSATRERIIRQQARPAYMATG